MSEVFTSDNLLIAGPHHADVGTCVVDGLGTAATYKRGTVLGRNDAGDVIILDTPALNDSNTAEYILAQDTEIGTSDTVAEVYRSGDFNEDYLIVASGYTLTEADRRNLKKVGIYLQKGITV